MDKKCASPCDRLGKVGGQAVLEGVMMKAGERTVTTCREEGGGIVVVDDSFHSLRDKNKFFNLPLVRGVVNFIESLMLSIRTLSASADALGIEEEDGKLERWLKKHLGIRLVDAVMVFSTVLGVALALFLFMFLPGAVSDLVSRIVRNLSGLPLTPTGKALVEGVAKIGIFLVYLFGVSFVPDIKRTFMYHGAEHKSIACFEAGEELTPENAMRHTRFHPRCGTSFMFFMILIGIIVGMLLNNIFPYMPRLALTGIRLLLLPLVVGIGYEFIRFAGKHPSPFTRALSAPGLWVQRITTKEPTADMLEVAIISLKCALRDDFPEFREFFEARPWEAEPEEKTATEEASEDENDTEGSN
ncbi:MAG: DUF1385 domain-containing protein [Clostridia bacterium]|nr:DUF1385 domain-containing protein [Clostridia bacterium]